MIPGARVRYCLLVTNNGPLAASNIIMTDSVPTTVNFVAGSMRSGTACATAAAVEDDDATGPDENDPVGANYAAPNLIAQQPSLASGASLAITFEAFVP
jgi:uncharacterized repeat protein (TIGR01451 family)